MSENLRGDFFDSHCIVIPKLPIHITRDNNVYINNSTTVTYKYLSNSLMLLHCNILTVGTMFVINYN